MSAEEPRRREPQTEDFRDFIARLDAEVAAEDREDARREAARLKAGLTKPPRDPCPGPGWADGGVTPSR